MAPLANIDSLVWCVPGRSHWRLRRLAATGSTGGCVGWSDAAQAVHAHAVLAASTLASSTAVHRSAACGSTLLMQANTCLMAAAYLQCIPGVAEGNGCPVVLSSALEGSST